jgi:hypothetical protein
MTTRTTQQMTARTMSMTLDPARENPIQSIVASIRGMQDDLTPRQREIRENGHRRTMTLAATGLYDPVHR